MSQSTAPSADAAHVEVKPMSVHIGAEIGGVDLRQPLNEAEVAAIRAALLEWKVVFFRDQIMSHAQHIAFSRNFAEPTPGHVVFGGDQQFPELYSIAKFRKANSKRGTAPLRPWSGWHTDVTAAINPPAFSVLRGVVVPVYGGDTMWTNLAAVFRSLSPALQSWLETLHGEHRYDPPTGAADSSDYDAEVKRNVLVAHHPLVTVHPETGEKVLYVSPSFLKSIPALNPAEGEHLMQMLFEQAILPEFTVRFRWEPGSVAMWDNRATSHLAPRDIFDVDFDRQFYRVTMMGKTPTGTDGKPSTLIEGNPITPV
jgi:alpha-ketoglutarate-dependent sulfate ester dioxygenase